MDRQDAMTDRKANVEVEIFIQILFHMKTTTECFEPAVVVSSEPRLSTILHQFVAHFIMVLKSFYCLPKL